MNDDVEKGVLGESISRSSIQVCSPPRNFSGEFFIGKVLFLCFENQPDGGIFGVLG